MVPANIIQFVTHLNWAYIACFLGTLLQPYVAAFFTAHAGWWTGMVNKVLSLASGFFATYAAQGSHFDVKTALGASGLAYILSGVEQNLGLRATGVANKLHSVGPQLGKNEPVAA